MQTFYSYGFNPMNQLVNINHQIKAIIVFFDIAPMLFTGQFFICLLNAGFHLNYL